MEGQTYEPDRKELWTHDRQGRWADWIGGQMGKLAGGPTGRQADYAFLVSKQNPDLSPTRER
jgi:hypothetical protein